MLIEREKVELPTDAKVCTRYVIPSATISVMVVPPEAMGVAVCVATGAIVGVGLDVAVTVAVSVAVSVGVGVRVVVALGVAV